MRDLANAPWKGAYPAGPLAGYADRRLAGARDRRPGRRRVGRQDRVHISRAGAFIRGAEGRGRSLCGRVPGSRSGSGFDGSRCSCPTRSTTRSHSSARSRPAPPSSIFLRSTAAASSPTSSPTAAPEPSSRPTSAKWRWARRSLPMPGWPIASSSARTPSGASPPLLGRCLRVAGRPPSPNSSGRPTQDPPHSRRSRPTTSPCCSIPAAPPGCRRERSSLTAISPVRSPATTAGLTRMD